MSKYHIFQIVISLMGKLEGGEDVRDLIVKVKSFWSRTLRYVVFSFITAIPVTMALLILNAFLGVKASFGFYTWIIIGVIGLCTSAQMAKNCDKLFTPINRKLIIKLEQERLERARLNNRRKNKKSQGKVS